MNLALYKSYICSQMGKRAEGKSRIWMLQVVRPMCPKEKEEHWGAGGGEFVLFFTLRLIVQIFDNVYVQI